MKNLIIFGVFTIASIALGQTTDYCNDTNRCTIDSCPNGYLRDNLGCIVCQCAPQTSPCQDVNCPGTCVNSGFARDANGCEVCQCVDPDECMQLSCDLQCSSGYLNVNGCPTCACNSPSTTTVSTTTGQVSSTSYSFCKEQQCYNECANGYVQDAYGCDTCICKRVGFCPRIRCDYRCTETGYMVDSDGCEYCECAYPTCPPLHGCFLDCGSHGHIRDERNCDMCACRSPPGPATTPSVASSTTAGPLTTKQSCPVCDMECEFGLKTGADGCNICECINYDQCPLMTCPEGIPQCSYGFQRDGNGCETCACNQSPVCSQLHCDTPEWQCAYGYKRDSNNCPYCECATSPSDPTPTPTPTSVCVPVTCSTYCPGATRRDSNGCETCECDVSSTRPSTTQASCPSLHCSNECPDELYTQDSNGCETCDCVLPTTRPSTTTTQVNCPALDCPNECPDELYARDVSGCMTCTCYQQTTQPTPFVSSTTAPCPALHCTNECEADLYWKDERGCDTCTCYSRNLCPTGCEIECPRGRELDVNGCELCRCRAEPSLSPPTVCPTLRCENECEADLYWKDEQGCDTCQCYSSDLCPKLECTKSCPTGNRVDMNGCTLCQCLPQPTDFLPTTTKQPVNCPILRCENECEADLYWKDERGCDTCQCYSSDLCPKLECSNSCPAGNRVDMNGCKLCQCLPHPTDTILTTTSQPSSCPTLRCENECEADLYWKDQNGCDTCECYSPYKCPVYKCAYSCQFGYEMDANGCKLCTCRTGYKTTPVPPSCPDNSQCQLQCYNGYKTDGVGCNLCECQNNCYKVRCDERCEYGLKRDENNCEYCECQPRPTEVPSSNCPEINNVECSFGRRINENGCETDECKEHMCEGVDCEEGKICRHFATECETNSCPLYTRCVNPDLKNRCTVENNHPSCAVTSSQWYHDEFSNSCERSQHCVAGFNNRFSSREQCNLVCADEQTASITSSLESNQLFSSLLARSQDFRRTLLGELKKWLINTNLKGISFFNITASLSKKLQIEFNLTHNTETNPKAAFNNLIEKMNNRITKLRYGGKMFVFPQEGLRFRRLNDGKVGTKGGLVSSPLQTVGISVGIVAFIVLIFATLGMLAYIHVRRTRKTQFSEESSEIGFTNNAYNSMEDNQSEKKVPIN